MKRLLAAGGEAIYQIAHAFRQGEVGRLHNPEFTMVEWYRTGDDLLAGMQLLSDLSEVLIERGPADRITYAEAFQQAAGVDSHRDSIDTLRGRCKNAESCRRQAWKWKIATAGSICCWSNSSNQRWGRTTDDRLRLSA